MPTNIKIYTWQHIIKHVMYDQRMTVTRAGGIKWDTWHLTPDTWHLTPDTWHLTPDTYEWLAEYPARVLSNFPPALLFPTARGTADDLASGNKLSKIMGSISAGIFYFTSEHCSKSSVENSSEKEGQHDWWLWTIIRISTEHYKSKIPDSLS